MTRGRVLAFVALVVCALIVSCSSSNAKPSVGNVLSLEEIHPDTNDPFGVRACQHADTDAATGQNAGAAPETRWRRLRYKHKRRWHDRRWLGLTSANVAPCGVVTSTTTLTGKTSAAGLNSAAVP